MLTLYELALTGLAALAAGVINALAGGGTLISFPALVALGIPEVTANITNTVALCPGYLGERSPSGRTSPGRAGVSVAGPGCDHRRHHRRILLIFISENVFRVLVPFLILISSILLAVQDRVRNWILGQVGRVRLKVRE